MSISLNNHETRISNLEKKPSSGISRQQLLGSLGSGSGTLSSAITNFNIILLSYSDDGSIASQAVDPKTVSYGQSRVIAGGSGTNSNARMNYTFDSATVVRITGGNKYKGFTSIIGFSWGGGINLGTLLQRLLVYIKTYSKLFHLQFLEVK